MLVFFNMTSLLNQTHTLGMLISGKKLEMHFVKWPPVYMKHTLSKPALSTERLVYTKRTFEKSSVVSPTANATYFEKVTSRLYQMPTLGAEPTRTEPNRAGPPGGGRG
jgi:hypothetical protein